MDTIAFLNRAFRNIDLPPLSDDDMRDIGEALQATRPTADLGDLVMRLRALAERQRNERGDYLDRGQPDAELEQAADRLILYREALEAYVAAHDAWIEKDAGINAAIHAADAVVKASNNARAVLSRSGL